MEDNLLKHAAIFVLCFSGASFFSSSISGWVGPEWGWATFAGFYFAGAYAVWRGER